MTTFPFPTPSHRDTAILALLPAVAVLAAATAAVRWRAAILVLMLVVFAEHSLRLRRLERGAAGVEALSADAAHSRTVRLKAAAPANAPFRIAGYNADFFPNLATMYGLEDIRAHDPMESARYVGMLALVAGYNTVELLRDVAEHDHDAARLPQRPLLRDRAGTRARPAAIHAWCTTAPTAASSRTTTSCRASTPRAMSRSSGT